MKKIIILAVFAIVTSAVFSQTADTASKHQFLLIFRFKANFVPPSQQALQNNIARWQEYMGGLGQAGALVTGYRPSNTGKTISGVEKVEKDSVYIDNNELVSSFIIINATNLEDAGTIAKKCPIFEFGGSVEIRPLSETAR